MKKFFVRVCKNNISVYYERINDELMVCFEQPTENQMNVLIFSNSVIIKQIGFTNDEVDFCRRFYNNNIGHIQELISQNIQ